MQFRVVQPWPGSEIGRESLVQVGSVMMPKKFSLQVTDDEGTAPDVELVFEVRDGVPECREVHSIATPDGHEVRCSGLAGIRVEDLLEKAVQSMIAFKALPDGSTGYLPLSPPIREVRSARAARKVKITDDLLEEVAAIYRANIGSNPTQAVADHFDRRHRTATLYVKRAREKGFLGAAIKGKAGEQ